MRTPQIVFTVLLLASVPVVAQRGKPPAHGPSTFHGTPRTYEPNHNFSEQTGHPAAPHVDGKTWVGHDTGPDDPH